MFIHSFVLPRPLFFAGAVLWKSLPAMDSVWTPLFAMTFEAKFIDGKRSDVTAEVFRKRNKESCFSTGIQSFLILETVDL
jgi:hypothetical protein